MPLPTQQGLDVDYYGTYSMFYQEFSESMRPHGRASDRCLASASQRRPDPRNLLGGLALVIGPLLWTSGLFIQWLARQQANLGSAELAALGSDTFAAPVLLAVHEREPGLSTAGWSLLLLGVLLLVPATVTLAQFASLRAPLAASLGATLMIFGQMSRMFYLGVDAVAFNMVERLGSDDAASLFLPGYGDLAYAFWRIPVVAAAGTIAGSVFLAIAAFRSQCLGLGRCLLLLPAGWLGMGVLKEHELGLGGLALAIALVPFGVALLRNREPRSRRIIRIDSHSKGPWHGVLTW